MASIHFVYKESYNLQQLVSNVLLTLRLPSGFGIGVVDITANAQVLPFIGCEIILG